MKVDFVDKLRDRDFLPWLEEFSSHKEDIQRAANRSRMNNELYQEFLHNIWYEIITSDLIRWLVSHITSKYDICPTIVEVGAGNGKLSHHLSKALSTSYNANFTPYYPVDHSERKWENVEWIDQNKAIIKYSPQVIICSRLELHPLPMLSLEEKQLMKSGRRKSDDQMTDSDIAMLKHYGNLSDWPDSTFYRRKQKSLQEYILIGPTDSCWDLIKTCGMKRDIEWCVVDDYGNSLYKQDGFKKEYLKIQTLNRLQLLFDSFGDYSQVTSFQKQNN